MLPFADAFEKTFEDDRDADRRLIIFMDGERPGMIQSLYEAGKHSAVKCVTGDCRIALRPFSGLGEEAL